jgi:signal transduction histidine kinase
MLSPRNSRVSQSRTLGDVISGVSLRRKLTILVAVGVILPLVVLTYLQYRSLAELQRNTKGAFKDGVRQGLANFEQKIKQRLEVVATQTLSPIANNNLSAEDLDRQFADVKHAHPEIEEVFAYASGHAYLYSNKFVEVPLAEFTTRQSLFNKSAAAQSFLDGDRKFLFQHDPSTGTYLFLPLKNGGFAGVLLSKAFVSNELIAGSLIETAGPSHSGNSPTAMAVTISTDNNQTLFSNGPPQSGYLFESNLDPPFSNWRVAVGLKNTNLDALARDSFLHSAGATFLVLLVLLLGIALIIRATDREARLAQAKSNFVANVSHELKTPLSLLSLFSEILELGRTRNEEKKLEYYRIIRHESRRLNKIIDNILDFSKIEAGRKTYRFAYGDIAEVIENVLSGYRYQISNSGFDMQTNIQPDLPSLWFDREAMAQAISNLVDNAIKYSRDVKQLSITTKALESHLSIEVADRGIGIPRAEQVKVFEKFYRVGNGLVHDVKGSGLGLSLVKHIVEAHDGTISVESEAGNGTRFTILLPLVRS